MPLRRVLQVRWISAFPKLVGGFLTLLSIAYVWASFHLESRAFEWILLIAAMIHLICAALLQGEQFQLPACVGLLLAADTSLLVFSLWAGARFGFHHFYLALAAVPLLLIDRKNRKAILFCIGAAVFCYLFMESGGAELVTPVATPPETVRILYWVLLPARFLFLILGAYYFATIKDKAQARVHLTLSELKESVRTQQALLEAIPDMIFRVSGDGRFLDFHCQNEADLFLPPEKLVGRKITEVLPDGISRPLLSCVVDSIALDQMRTYSFEFAHQGAKEHRYYEARVVGTGPNDALMVVQNVSERIRAERTILEQRARGATASRMAALGEMAGGIAHEINNPLAIIQGRAQQLKEMTEVPEIERVSLWKLADGIEQTVVRISKIIRSLRIFARDGQEDPFELASVREIVADTLEFCRQRFYSHDIDLRIPEISPDLEMECRSVQIGQVLLNLLNNAHDAIVESRKSSSREKWIELSVEDLGEQVRISVSDSGVGIPPEIRERILQPFFTTKEVGKGTGLGLSISKGILDAHHGSLFLDCSSSSTRFVLELPKWQPLPEISVSKRQESVSANEA